MGSLARGCGGGVTGCSFMGKPEPVSLSKPCNSWSCMPGRSLCRPPDIEYSVHVPPYRSCIIVSILLCKTDPSCLSDANILATLHGYATNKKSGYERESAAIAFQSLATILGAPAAPLLLPSLPTLFDLYMDKGDVVRIASTAATKAILKLFPPESTRVVFRTLEDIAEKAKWRSKVGVLDAMKSFVNTSKEHVAKELGTTIPKVEAAMHDTKAEVCQLFLVCRVFRRSYLLQVSTAAIKCATTLCSTLANPDLTPHIPTLVKCMSNPDTVPQCIKSLSNTTFVAEVTAPALAVLVPLLIRALNDRSMEVQRRTVVVIDNLVKLVRDPNVAATYLSPLVDGVEKIAKGAAFPEVCLLHFVLL